MYFQHIDVPVVEQTGLAIALKEQYDKKKMEKLICSFSRFVQKTAWSKSKRMTDPSLLIDLCSVGVEAIFKAVAKYDPLKNDNFFKYATLWIRAEMRVFQKKHNSVLYMGDVKFHTLFSKYAEVSDLSVAEQAKALSSVRIDKKGREIKVKMTENDIAIYKQAIRPASSLLKINSEGEQISEEICESDTPNPENIIAFKQVYDLSNKFMGNLTEREKVIWMDFLTFEPNHAEVSKVVGITRERVRQISVSLQEAFRKHLEKHGINSQSVSVQY